MLEPSLQRLDELIQRKKEEHRGCGCLHSDAQCFRGEELQLLMQVRAEMGQLVSALRTVATIPLGVLSAMQSAGWGKNSSGEWHPPSCLAAFSQAEAVWIYLKDKGKAAHE